MKFETLRVFEITCDSCGKSLNKTKHINIKNPDEILKEEKKEHLCQFCKVILSDNVKGFDAYGRRI